MYLLRRMVSLRGNVLPVIDRMPREYLNGRSSPQRYFDRSFACVGRSLSSMCAKQK